MEEAFDDVSYYFNEFLTLMRRQYERTYNELDSRKVIHLCIIVGGYLILRPYITKLFGIGIHARSDKTDRDKKKRKGKSRPAGVPNKTSANALRYGPLAQEVEVSDDTASDDSDCQPATEEDKKDQMIRRRQRRLLRGKLDDDAMQQFADEEWEDPDIADLMPPGQQT